MRLIKLLSLLGCFLYTPAIAQTANWYRVEVMLVAYTNEQQMQLENWPVSLTKESKATASTAENEQEAELEPTAIVDDEAVEELAEELLVDELASEPEPPLKWWLEPEINRYSALLSNFEFAKFPKASWPMPLQPLDNLMLADSLKHFQKRSDMQVIWHQGWVEPIQERKHSIAHPINIELDAPYFHLSLTGQFQLSVSRYLHFSTNFEIQHNTTDGEAIRAATIKQTRRMRSNELHYLDHPMLGVMVKVVPIKNELELLQF